MRRTALDLIAARYWLIEPEALQTIVDIANRDIEALAAKTGRPLDNTRTVEMREGGVAVIPVSGPIFPKANIFTEISGATSTQTIAKDFRESLDNPSVRAIALHFSSSPGGATEGIHELSAMIHAARGRKPIVAYVGHMAASAAYWIAAAADRIVLDKTAMVGSIGVVSEVRAEDTSERDAKSGTRTYTIVSNVSPKKCLDPSTEEGRAEVQGVVDHIGQVFVDSIAAYRGVSVKKVLSDFGQGSVLVGSAALSAGMVDRLGSFESVIAELQRSSKQSSSKPTGETTGMTTSQIDGLLRAERVRVLAILKACAPSVSAEVRELIANGAEHTLGGDATRGNKAPIDRKAIYASRQAATAAPATQTSRPDRSAVDLNASTVGVYARRAKQVQAVAAGSDQ